ncbi:MAG: GGDEF domain-containing phosphodiesterase [Desulfovibrio sp.]|nr:GGDEF domain-containing phosphodiesterase [Desulfovibrio sp.]
MNPHNDQRALTQASSNAAKRAAAQTLIFLWKDEQAMFTAPELRAEFAGHYDRRAPLLVWSQDQVVHPDDQGRLSDCLQKLACGIPYIEANFRLKMRTGAYALCACTFTLTEGKIPQHIGTLRVKGTQQIPRPEIHRDPLTGVLTARAFFAATDKLLAQKDRQYCLIRCTVCALKQINQKQGFARGDHLLKLIARFLRRTLLPGAESLGRMDGNDFAVCLLGGPKRALHFAQSLSRLFENKSRHRHADLCFGICTASQNTTPAYLLYDWATVALETVKGSDVHNVAFYDDQLKKLEQDKVYITSHMACALKNDEFKLYLQPKVLIDTGQVVGAEALARWLHPKDGMIMPDRFVPLFESNGFILKLDDYIWEETCKTLRRWIDNGYEPVPISVNVSRLHFTNTDLLRTFRFLTEKYQLPHHLLELEVTETAFIPGWQELLRKMRLLRKAGFALSMDDFGIGYSSLSSLRDLPFTAVKLDRVFVQGECASDRGRIVAKNTIKLAKELKLQIVAEGVESEEQAQFLLENDCHIAQGFYYARPMPAKMFEESSFLRLKTDLNRYQALKKLRAMPLKLKACQS